MRLIIVAMVFLGAALMVWNIYGFVRFARFVKQSRSWDQNNTVLYIPIVLLIFFLLGYLGIGTFGNPDLLVAGILFGGSIFVFIIYRLLFSITRRVMKQEQLESQLIAEKVSNQAKSRFLDGMSHEMRTPMNVILGTTAIALKDPDISPQTRKQLNRIEVSGEHLLQMINNLLDINNMESRTIEIRRELFVTGVLLERIDGVAESMCGEKGLEYQMTVGEGVGECYMGDMPVIEQILLSILSNAAKFTDAPGKVSMLVDAANDTTGGRQMLQFAISDTGIGIDDDFLPQLYDLFAREDSTSTSRFGGSGIGLAATKRKVDLLGGSIQVESEKGKGSVFTVTLPMEIPSEDDIRAAAEKSDDADIASPQNHEDRSSGDTAEASGSGVETGNPGLEGRRILIVEDIPENAEIVADLLELEGADSEHAENGQIAMDMFLASPPHYYDAILMDLRMPVLNGHSAAKGIRASDHPDAGSVPILALTANAYDSDVQDSMDAGMNAHLVKPVDPDGLYESLERFIREFDRRKTDRIGRDSTEVTEA